jgi:chemotaxis-related protein WspB
MLMLLMYVGSDMYAIDTAPIVEIVPKVRLKKIPHAKKHVIGLLNFASTPIPVIDLCELIEGRPSSNAMHTRIILIKNSNPQDETKIMGLIAEKITEVVELEEEKFVSPGVKLADLPYFGGVLNYYEETIQFIKIDDLFNALKETLLNPV